MTAFGNFSIFQCTFLAVTDNFISLVAYSFLQEPVRTTDISAILHYTTMKVTGLCIHKHWENMYRSNWHTVGHPSLIYSPGRHVSLIQRGQCSRKWRILLWLPFRNEKELQGLSVFHTSLYGDTGNCRSSAEVIRLNADKWTSWRHVGTCWQGRGVGTWNVCCNSVICGESVKI
jgi:hypothetical protein